MNETLEKVNINKSEGGTGSKIRSSNLELYRIVVMLLIVAHHYVVNSGLLDANGPVYSNFMLRKSIFYFMLGAWGKTGINCFVLITGYFMCKSQVTVKKFVKLLAEVMFYNIVITVIFWTSGYETFTVKSLLKAIVPIQNVQQNFTGCYLIFFLFIPFLNILIQQLDEKKHMILMGLCAFTYIFFGTLHKVSMNYVSWYMVLFVIGSYIRIYPKPWFTKTSLWRWLTVASFFVSVTSILCCVWFGNKFGLDDVYSFVSDSNTFLAVTNGVCSFMFFKNLKVPQSRFINTVAASTFGVLCIHANSDIMRQWLWKDTLDNVAMYSSDYFWMHAIVSVIGVFAVCTLIDMVRIRLLEKPFLRKWFDESCKLRLFKSTCTRF